MANGFNIQPLGGFNVGDAFGQAMQQRENRAQQEQQQQQQADIKALTSQAATGDANAIEQLWGLNPEMAQFMEQRESKKIAEMGAMQAQQSKKAETDWGLRWKQAGPEDKQALLQEALENPLIDIDEDDVAVEGEQADLAVNTMLFGHLGKDAYKQLLGGTEQDKGFTLGQGQKRFSATGEQIASVAPKEAVTKPVLIPQELLEGLSPELSTKASAAYNAAGGGKDGMAAYQRQIDKGTEQERRTASPQILKSNFPQASTAEMSQLQGAMDAAKTTEAGLKSAAKVRVEQKRLVKAKGFQDRAVDLLGKILDNDELGDVLGSVEGAYDFRLQDSEAELIADIEEAGNILTADNLSLMSGVLSESDIKILKNLAGGGLIRTRSEPRFRADVTKLRDKLASSMVVTTDDRAGGGNNIDSQAMQWAKANPNDPRAAQILEKLRGK